MNDVAVVTGAASGIGAALCRLLAARGVAVVAADDDAAGLVGLAADTAIHTQVVDVSDDDQVRRLIHGAVAELGGIDFLFNTAGIRLGGAAEHMPLAQWQRIVDVNLWGVVHGTRHAYPLMRAQGSGHIVNMASIAGLTPVAPSAAYAMTEHAVVGLSTALRVEAAAAGVRVSVAVPGGVATDIVDSGIDLPGYSYRGPARRIPIGMIGSERAAQHILRGMRKNKPYIVFPRYNRAVLAAYRWCPRLMSRLGGRR
ncbi:SDR family oxidoreductase [Streptomyces gardneri]|uniref:SDR family NAD(P)-dependent oxidoreductase n=1 Tax=Nocardia TaxID=1817 RepID=UPI00135AA587|nr:MULTISPECIES: SDR family oxidoreductase [Nocardia]MBF6166834.1 SDR family oxidoreductase [Streptomyces gardneri]MBF6206665.1 SDR family oxidoreductase [Streptomyces gardneri]